MYLGDFPAAATIDFKWNTMSAAAGSITRATNGSIRVYKANSATQRSTSSGITDTEDFDSLTGLHHCRIDLSDDTDNGFYAPGNDYQVVIQGMVVDGITINAVIAEFSIENRHSEGGGSAPSAADIRAEIDANSTRLAALETNTQDIQSRLPADLTVDGNLKADAVKIDGADPSGTIRDAVVDDATRLDASALNDAAGTAIPAIQAKTDNLPEDPAGVSDVDDAVSGLASALGSAIGTPETSLAGDIAGLKAVADAIQEKTDTLPEDPAPASDIEAVMTRLGAPANGSLAADIAAAKEDTAAIREKTDSRVDANITHVNEVEVVGNGQTGNEWRPG